MLAQMAHSIEEVFQVQGEKTAFEYKFDGARVQIHKRNGEIRVFSRSLFDVTTSLPDIVALIEEKLTVKEIVVEGVAVAMGRKGKPMPFQNVMRRFRRIQKVEKMIEKIPIKLFLFDILYLNGNMLTETPYMERSKILETLCDEKLRTPRIITNDVNVAKEFLNKAMKSGHEGLMAKKLESEYTPGVRGKKWLKIKPIELLDLVIVAADWGYGRRTGWLSNYHLAARSEDEFIIIGKTFKGLTDEEFDVMTKRLKELTLNETSFTVNVKPKIVVEVAFNEIQKSSKYDSGFALRFARITRIREDMSPLDADTIDMIQELYEKQFKFRG
jgi:DNA ligase-1